MCVSVCVSVCMRAHVQCNLVKQRGCTVGLGSSFLSVLPNKQMTYRYLSDQVSDQPITDLSNASIDLVALVVRILFYVSKVCATQCKQFDPCGHYTIEGFHPEWYISTIYHA